MNFSSFLDVNHEMDVGLHGWVLRYTVHERDFVFQLYLFPPFKGFTARCEGLIFDSSGPYTANHPTERRIDRRGCSGAPPERTA